jgi:uncharacterized repeat protein (TIGR03803 family)
MNFSFKDSFLLLEFTLATGLLLSGEVRAQTLTIIHNFSSGECSFPYSEPIILSNKLYGTTTAGGTADTGTVFVMDAGSESGTPSSGEDRSFNNMLSMV